MDAIDHSRTPGTIIDTDDIATYDAKTVAEQRLEVLRNLSSYSFYRRFDPYNMNLATEYNENLEKLKELDIKLRQQSKFVGPYISDAETISSEFNLYKRMTKTTLTDFENAIKKMEKTKEPVEKPTFGVPFEKYFSDSRIVISDARDKEDDILLPKEITAPGTKACHALPVPIGKLR